MKESQDTFSVPSHLPNSNPIPSLNPIQFQQQTALADGQRPAHFPLSANVLRCWQRWADWGGNGEVGKAAGMEILNNWRKKGRNNPDSRLLIFGHCVLFFCINSHLSFFIKWLSECPLFLSGLDYLKADRNSEWNGKRMKRGKTRRRRRNARSHSIRLRHCFIFIHSLFSRRPTTDLNWCCDSI